MAPRAKTGGSLLSERTSSGRLPLWTFYRVTFNMLTRICASVPADPELVRRWLDARKPRVRPPGSPSIDEINEEVLASLERGEGEPDQEHSMLVFQRHGGHLVVRMGTIRGHYKDCAGVLSREYIGKIEGEKSFLSRIKNCVYYNPAVKWIPLLRPDGSFIAEADGSYDKPIHPMTRQGPISALKTFEFVEPPCSITFTLRVMNTQVRRSVVDDVTKEKTTQIVTMQNVAEDDLHYIFEYGGTHGYAGERGDGEGRYEYTLEKIDAEG